MKDQMQQQYTYNINANTTEKWVKDTNEKCLELRDLLLKIFESLPGTSMTEDIINLEETHTSIRKVRRTTKFGSTDSTSVDISNLHEDKIKILKAKIKTYQQKIASKSIIINFAFKAFKQ